MPRGAGTFRGTTSLSFTDEGVTATRDASAADYLGRRAMTPRRPDARFNDGGALIIEGGGGQEEVRRGPAATPFSARGHAGHFQANGSFVAAAAAARGPTPANAAAAYSLKANCGHFSASGAFRDATEELTPRLGEPSPGAAYAHGRPIERARSKVGQEAHDGNFNLDGSYRTMPPGRTESANAGIWASGTERHYDDGQPMTFQDYSAAAPPTPGSVYPISSAAPLASMGRSAHGGGGAVRAGPTAGLSTGKANKKELEALGLQFYEQVELSSAPNPPHRAPPEGPPRSPVSPTKPLNDNHRRTTEAPHRAAYAASPKGQRHRAGHIDPTMTAINSDRPELSVASVASTRDGRHGLPPSPPGAGPLPSETLPAGGRPPTRDTARRGRAQAGHYGPGSHFLDPEPGLSPRRPPANRATSTEGANAFAGHLVGAGSLNYPPGSLNPAAPSYVVQPTPRPGPAQAAEQLAGHLYGASILPKSPRDGGDAPAEPAEPTAATLKLTADMLAPHKPSFIFDGYPEGGAGPEGGGPEGGGPDVAYRPKPSFIFDDGAGERQDASITPFADTAVPPPHVQVPSPWPYDPSPREAQVRVEPPELATCSSPILASVAGLDDTITPHGEPRGPEGGDKSAAHAAQGVPPLWTGDQKRWYRM